MLFKKVTTFSARTSNQKIHQGVARRLEGLKGAAVPVIAKKILDL
jgi:hypothetical protein